MLNIGVEDVKTQSMMPYASSSTNIHGSRTTITRYGQVLPLNSSSQMDSTKNFMQGTNYFFFNSPIIFKFVFLAFSI